MGDEVIVELRSGSASVVCAAATRRFGAVRVDEDDNSEASRTPNRPSPPPPPWGSTSPPAASSRAAPRPPLSPTIALPRATPLSAAASSRAAARPTAPCAPLRRTPPGGGGRSFLGLNLRKYGAHNDPQVLIAREKVATAVEAKKEADRALLHDCAAPMALRTKAKQAVAKLVTKDARGLWRYG
ncbi:hypothetical protein B0H10DRAFT_2437851 [Mycena sp. CBHHK59/15]|nr:hypothetical protein B0H10DRAFT_2437851 [Mycena sp. CBHHK59/15]